MSSWPSADLSASVSSRSAALGLARHLARIDRCLCQGAAKQLARGDHAVLAVQEDPDEALHRPVVQPQLQEAANRVGREQGAALREGLEFGAPHEFGHRAQPRPAQGGYPWRRFGP
jgi:hypothetical protein